ncbi:MAG: tetratricopeptide repeat protein [Treponema sp.]|nr:tetratricopeptide repeat protein [Treponema sp.]
MITKTGTRISVVCFCLSLPFLYACSSAPQNSGEMYDLRNQSEAQLDLGTKEAYRGNYETALLMLNEARRIAVSVDDPSLRIRTGLSRGNVLFALGQNSEAAAGWENALAEAEQLGNPELIAVSRIHKARGSLLSPGGGASAQAVRETTIQEMTAVKDSLYTAFAYMVIGLSEKEMGRYAEAEAALSRSQEIHEAERNLELAAYDWYLIGSFRSLSGNYDGARQALESAMALDRRVENSYGLATDWRALGDVLKKAGKDEESRQAYLRSAEIFRALGNNNEAEETEKR